MTTNNRAKPACIIAAAGLAAATLALSLSAPLHAARATAASASGTRLPTGQVITPLAIPGARLDELNPRLPGHPAFRAGGMVTLAISPDRRTLLAMTSGFNKLFAKIPKAGAAGANVYRKRKPVVDAGDEYIFVYDISGAHAAAPRPLQVLHLPQSFLGLAFAPDGKRFYASGGAADAVFIFARGPGGWAAAGSIPIGHGKFAARLPGGANAPGWARAFAPHLDSGLGIDTNAMAAGLALSADGSLLAIANASNDSVSVIDTRSRALVWEYDLRPFHAGPFQAGSGTGQGRAGGETPFGVAIANNANGLAQIYIAALRDREIVVLPLSRTAPPAGAAQRIALSGNPNRLLADPARARLYAPLDNSDRVAVIDTAHSSLIAQWPVLPAGLQGRTGAAANDAAITADGSRLYVSLGGANALAVIDPAHGENGARALLPTAWYPHAVALGPQGMVYAATGRSTAGPNPEEEDHTSGQYVLQLSSAALQSFPTPRDASLSGLTRQVEANNFYDRQTPRAEQDMAAFLHAHIHHVIYVLKENRTFDQVLGDLGNGADGDRRLTMFPESVTPNQHQLARRFATLDRFFCAGQVSGNGWPWSTQARETDFGVKTIPLAYAQRGFANGSEGTVRNINPAAGAAARAARAYLTGDQDTDHDGDGDDGIDPPGQRAALDHALPGGRDNLLPGPANEFAADGPPGTPREQGFLWDAALRAGLRVRNYGFMLDLARYDLPPGQGGIALLPDPYDRRLIMAFPANPTLAPNTDLYFRGFDNLYPDLWRVREWQREFAGYEAQKSLPELMLVRLPHDHMGNFCAAPAPYTEAGCPAGGLNTPDLQQADNDYALGLLVQTVAHSRFAADTLIVVLEDDSQNGPDHVDAQRSTAYFAGPYLRHGAIVSTPYGTVNALRTIEAVLGLPPLNLNDAHQPMMSAIFDRNQPDWDFTAILPAVLRTAPLGAGLPPSPTSDAAPLRPHPNGAWWARATRGMDFSAEDRIPAARYNAILWRGLMGAPAP